MRIRAVLLLLFFAVILGVGCRKPLSPNVDRNRAPETWIVAAPQDTLTVKDPAGKVIPAPPGTNTIPVRYHMYWAASDQDGAVAGFYWAVVETVTTIPEGLDALPPLPGPKAADYRFTPRSDTTFIFNVSEASPDRQHAFYIYAVDDKGKADATPARFLFNALDRFPPTLVMLSDWAYARGPVVRTPTSPTVVIDTLTFFIEDSLNIANLGKPPADTIPSAAHIHFRWRGVPSIDGTFVTGYKYKLDEPAFIEGRAGDTTATYNTRIGNDIIRPGTKTFTVKALDQAGGAREKTRRFQVNFTPDTWFSGPDPAAFPPPAPEQPGRPPHRFINVTNWAAIPPIPGSVLSCDSLTKLPALRTQRRTFFEIYGDRLFIRSENDTVHMNSWVVFFGGGYDKDSPYNVKVSNNDPVRDTVVCNPATVIRPSGLNGSPIGFRFQYGVLEDLDYRTLSAPTEFGLRPIFDAASVFRNTLVACYGEMYQSGLVYMVLRSEDGEGGIDKRIPSAAVARQIVDAVNNGTADAATTALRSRILTFYVNYSPYLDFEASDFFPKPPQYNTPPGTVASSPDRKLRLVLRGIDEDPLDNATRPPRTGGPSPSTVLRTTVTVIGKNAGGRDTSYRAPSSFTPSFVIDLPVDAPYIVGTDLILRVELCDCPECEITPGSGRCIDYRTDARYSIPVTVPPPTAARTTSANVSTTVPGSPQAVGRSSP
jgi:hypothetical protein